MRKNKYAIIIVITIFICLIMIVPKQNIINIMDYVKVEFDGSNGNGKVNYFLDTAALDAALCASNSENSSQETTDENYDFYSGDGSVDWTGMLDEFVDIFSTNYSDFIDTIKIVPNKAEGLSNGEYVTFKVTWDNEMAKNYNLNMGAYNKIFKVSGLNYTQTLGDDFSSLMFLLGLSEENDVSFSEYIKYKSLEKADYLLSSITNGGKENYLLITPVSNEKITLNMFSTYNVVDVKHGSDESFIGIQNGKEIYYIEAKDFCKYFVDNNANVVTKICEGVGSYLFLMNADDIKINLVVSTIFGFVAAGLMCLYYLFTVKFKLTHEKVLSLPIPALVFNCSVLLLNIFNPYLFYWHVNEKLFNIPTKETIFEQVAIFVILVFIIVAIVVELVSLIYQYKATGLLLAMLYILINVFALISVYGCYAFALAMFIKCVIFVDKGKKVVKEDKQINSFKKLMVDDLF